MPSLRTVQRWRDVHPDFDAMLDRARQQWADSILEDVIAITDEVVTDSAPATRQRTRAEMRLKAIAKLHPARYSEASERIGIKIGIGNEPAAIENDPMQVARRVAFLLARASADDAVPSSMPASAGHEFAAAYNARPAPSQPTSEEPRTGPDPVDQALLDADPDAYVREELARQEEAWLSTHLGSAEEQGRVSRSTPRVITGMRPPLTRKH